MAVGDAHMFPGFLTLVLFLQSHRLLFSHALAEVRGENMKRLFVIEKFSFTNATKLKALASNNIKVIQKISVHVFLY